MMSSLRTDDQLREIYSGYKCNPSSFATVLFPTGAVGTIGLKVAAPTVEAWKLFSAHMERIGYFFEELAGGTYNCRQIAGSSKWSLHSYAIALDLNPSRNPRGTPLTTDMPSALYEWAEGCVTADSGVRVFAWGGRWKNPDPMHYQINASPNELAEGIKYPMTDEQMAELKAYIDAAISEVGQQVWHYKGVFAKDDPADNAERTLRRAESRTITILSNTNEILDSLTPDDPA